MKFTTLDDDDGENSCKKMTEMNWFLKYIKWIAWGNWVIPSSLPLDEGRRRSSCKEKKSKTHFAAVQCTHDLQGFVTCVMMPRIFKASPLRTTLPMAQYTGAGEMSLVALITTSTDPCETPPGLGVWGSWRFIFATPELCMLAIMLFNDMIFCTAFPLPLLPLSLLDLSFLLLCLWSFSQQPKLRLWADDDDDDLQPERENMMSWWDSDSATWETESDELLRNSDRTATLDKNLMQSWGDSATQEIRESDNLMMMMMILEPKMSENLRTWWWWFCNPRYQRLWWADDDDSATQDIREFDIELLLMMILQPKTSDNLRSWWRLWDSDEILQQLKRIWWDDSFESLLAHTFVSEWSTFCL